MSRHSESTKFEAELINRVSVFSVDPGIGGYIRFGRKKTLYATIPKPAVDFIKSRFGIDLYDGLNRKDLKTPLIITVEKETSNPSAQTKLMLTFEIAKIPSKNDVADAKEKMNRGRENAERR